jgi:uncharacterized membrane protein YkgB
LTLYREKLMGLDLSHARISSDGDSRSVDAAEHVSDLESGRDLLARAVKPIRASLAIVYFHFGLLKFFPDLSSAEMLATQTILRLGPGVDVHTVLYGLAIFECAIALMLVLDVSMGVVFPLFLLHMVGTFLPVFFLPELAFKYVPFVPNLVGQYIIKNLVFIAAGWALYLGDSSRQSQSQGVGK